MASSSSPGSAAGRTQKAMDEFTTSSLRTQDQVDALCRWQGVGKDIRVSPVEEDVSAPPPAGAVCVHVYALDAGFCCRPRQRFYNEVLSHFGIAPSQLTPNSWRTMAGFVGFGHKLGVKPSVTVFRCFFTISPVNHSSKSYFYFRSRFNGRRFFCPQDSTTYVTNKIPSTTWKKDIFLVWSPEPWACPTVWGKPSESSIAEPTQLTMGERSAKQKLEAALGRGWLDITQFCHLYDRNNDDSAMTPPLPSPRANASSAQGTDPTANAMVSTDEAEKGTAVVQASAADYSPRGSALLGKKRNREEAHTEGPLRLDLRRVSLPVFSEHNTPDMNAADMSMALPDQSLTQAKALLPELLDAAKKADALREEEMKNMKAQLSEANEAGKQEKALRDELKKTKAQLSEANEAVRLEKEKAKQEKKNADALSEELKKTKAQLSKANEAARLEKLKAGALREELKKKGEASVALKEVAKEIMEKCSQITNCSDV